MTTYEQVPKTIRIEGVGYRLMFEKYVFSDSPLHTKFNIPSASIVPTYYNAKNKKVIVTWEGKPIDLRKSPDLEKDLKEDIWMQKEYERRQK